MRCESKEAAIACAARMNAYRVGRPPIRAVRTIHGWGVIEFTAYSQGCVLEYAEQPRRKVGDLTDDEWLSIGAIHRTT
jgi:hypothetical protein